MHAPERISPPGPTFELTPTTALTQRIAEARGGGWKAPTGGLGGPQQRTRGQSCKHAGNWPV